MLAGKWPLEEESQAESWEKWRWECIACSSNFLFPTRMLEGKLWLGRGPGEGRRASSLLLRMRFKRIMKVEMAGYCYWFNGKGAPGSGVPAAIHVQVYCIKKGGKWVRGGARVKLTNRTVSVKSISQAGCLHCLAWYDSLRNELLMRQHPHK